MLSARIIPRIVPCGKPSVRRTAISVTLSRAAIAIVLAAIRRMTRTMIVEMRVTRSFTFPSIETKPFWNSFSVSVFVGYGEFSNIASISLRAARSTAASESALIQNRPDEALHAREGLLEVLAVEVDGRVSSGRS